MVGDPFQVCIKMTNGKWVGDAKWQRKGRDDGEEMADGLYRKWKGTGDL